ncbi:MAG TPA: hypothetical protein VN853_23425 [Polyangia bacterium]|nr:hypothetical protein [Polyangia bacterium]
MIEHTGPRFRRRASVADDNQRIELEALDDLPVVAELERRAGRQAGARERMDSGGRRDGGAELAGIEAARDLRLDLDVERSLRRTRRQAGLVDLVERHQRRAHRRPHCSATGSRSTRDSVSVREGDT